MFKTDRQIIKRSGLFDANYYLKSYPDVRLSDIDPLKHFCKYGWKEGRNPSVEFDTNFYLSRYPDVLASNINPLVHYIKDGKYEGRFPNSNRSYPNINESYFTHRIKTLKKLIGLFRKDSKLKSKIFNELKRGSFVEAKRVLQEKMHLEYFMGADCHIAASIEIKDDDSIGILTTPHTLFVAHLLQHALQKHSRNSHIILQQDFNAIEYQLYIVICPQMFSVLPPLYIAFQMEQSVNSRWFTPAYFKTLENSLAVFEYSMKNIDYLLSNHLSYKQIFYMPISYFDHYSDYLKNNGYWDGKTNAESSDVVFYGDPNAPRRAEFLQALKKKFKVKIVSEVYGTALYRELMSAKVVVNIHYYEGALLETTRIYECMSLGIPVISETSIDIDEHQNLQNCIEFTEIGNIDAMLQAVERLLSNENLLKEKTKAIKTTLSKNSLFNFYFDRFLFSHGLLPLSSVVSHSDIVVKIPEHNMVCLGLPESCSRRQSFTDDNVHGIEIFDGIRHQTGWIGCASSYKFLMQAAIKNNLEYMIICEDDVEFTVDFSNKLEKILNYLQQTTKQWHIFSGLIADVHPETKILHIDQYDGIEYIFIDKMTSTVFNIYHKSIFEVIANWDETNTDVHTNTIDRFIESQMNIITITSLPYLVGHKEEENSTIWGFNNSQYKDMIASSEQKLLEKVKEYKEYEV